MIWSWPAAALTVVLLAPTAGIAAPAADGYEVIFHGTVTSLDKMLDDLATADVVFVGEEHDYALGHTLEMRILEGLYAKRPKTVLSLEMFERDVQPIVDEYLADYITEAQFLAASRPWPNYKTDYRPMVEFCREHKLPVVAANAPRRYVNIVSRKGPAALDSLPRVSRTWLVRLPYGLELPAGYDKMLTELFDASHGRTGSAAPPGMPSTENMKAAQALWDATMADSVLRAIHTHRGSVIMQVNGSGHSDHGWGIVDRLRRSNPRLKIAIVSIKADAEYPNVPPDKYADDADYMIVGPPARP